MNKIFNQKGFTGLETILLVILTAVIVGVGFYVYNARNDEKTETVSTSTSSQENTSELVIKEHGTVLTLPKGLEDLKYEIGENGIALFTTDSLEKAAEGTTNPVGDNGQSKVCSYGAIGSIGKSDTAEEAGPFTVESKKLGNFYVTMYTMPDGGPCSDSDDVAKKATSQHQLLKQAFETIELQ